MAFLKPFAFDDRVSELEFCDYFVSRRILYYRYFLFAGSLVYYLFFIWDSILDSSNAGTTQFLRGVLVSPVLFGCGVIIGIIKSKRLVELAITICAIYSTFILSVIFSILNKGFEYGVAGTILVMMYFFCLIAVRFQYSMIFSISTLANFKLCESLNPPIQPNLGNMNTIYLLGAITVGLIASAWRELEGREKFLTERSLEEARSRIDDLLHSILPSNIVSRVQQGESPIADSYGEVSIVFVDLVGFTELSRRVGARHLIEILNAVFSRFDQIAQRHNVERIKTIGDAYMAVAGLDLVGQSGDHAEQAANFAIDVNDAVQEVSNEFGIKLQVRTGLHVGSVVAGVVGSKRPAFDCWGDSVNLASRLESAGGEYGVIISESAALRLQKKFKISVHRDVELKGIGVTKVFVLEGRLT